MKIPSVAVLFAFLLVLAGVTDAVPFGPSGSTDFAVASSTEVPVSSSTEVPVSFSTEVPVASSTEVPVASSTEVPVSSSTAVPVASSTEVPVASSTEVPVASSTEVPVASSTEVPVASSTEVLAASSTEVVSSSEEEDIEFLCYSNATGTPLPANYSLIQCVSIGGAPVSPSAQELVTCTGYASATCCSPTTENIVQLALPSLLNIYGSDCCYTNLVNLMCGLICSPCSGISNEFVIATTLSLNFYIDRDYASAVYDSCADTCYMGGANRTREYAADVDEFFLSLQPGNDPNFQLIPSFHSPSINYVIGEFSSLNGQFYTNVLSACGIDAPSECPPSTASDESSTVTVETSSTTMVESSGSYLRISILVFVFVMIALFQ